MTVAGLIDFWWITSIIFSVVFLLGFLGSLLWFTDTYYYRQHGKYMASDKRAIKTWFRLFYLTAFWPVLLVSVGPWLLLRLVSYVRVNVYDKDPWTLNPWSNR